MPETYSKFENPDIVRTEQFIQMFSVLYSVTFSTCSDILRDIKAYSGILSHIQTYSEL